MQDWTTQEIWKLRKYYANESIGGLMDRLEKTEEEIMSMAARLKLNIRKAATGGTIVHPRPGVLVHRMGI